MEQTLSIGATLATIEEHAEVVLDTDQFPAGTPEWHSQRREGIGGSDAAAAGGDFSPWQSPYSLWVDKVIALPPIEPTAAMKSGTKLEEPIGLWWAEEEGIEVVRFPKMLRSRLYPFMQLDVDFLQAGGVVEVKNVNAFTEEWGDGEQPEVPRHYTLQGQHSLAVTGLPFVDFAVLVGGQKLLSVRTERNDALIADLVTLEAQFWQRVLDKAAPPLDGSKATKEALLAQYTKVNGLSIELPPEAAEYLSARRELKRQIKELEEEKTRFENEVKDMLKDHESGTINGKEAVTWKEVAGSTFMVTREPTRRLLPKGEWK